MVRVSLQTLIRSQQTLKGSKSRGVSTRATVVQRQRRKASIFLPPRTLSAPPSPPAIPHKQSDGKLVDVLRSISPPNLTEAFFAQGVSTLDEAGELTIDEVREVLNQSGITPTVGLVRKIVSAVQRAKAESDPGEAQSADDVLSVRRTPDSVLSRAMLRMDPNNLRDALLLRLTTESVYASLMLTIAVGALFASPGEEGLDRCKQTLSDGECKGLQRAWRILWGLSSAFFLISCTVSLGAIQLFVGVSTEDSIHYVLVKSEQYLNLSFWNISGGFLGLMGGISIFGFLNFPEDPISCWVLFAGVWVLWVQQLWAAGDSISQIYCRFPGWQGIPQFLRGYFAIGNTLQPVAVPEEERSTLAPATEERNTLAPTTERKVQGCKMHSCAGLPPVAASQSCSPPTALAAAFVDSSQRRIDLVPPAPPTSAYVESSHIKPASEVPSTTLKPRLQQQQEEAHKHSGSPPVATTQSLCSSAAKVGSSAASLWREP